MKPTVYIETTIPSYYHYDRAEISAKFGDDLDRYAEHLQTLRQQYGDRLVGQITVVPPSAGSAEAAKPR